MAYKLADIADKPVRNVIGLISGTSMDGMDAAMVRIEGRGLGLKVKVLAYDTYEYPEEIAEAIAAVAVPDRGTTGDICRLNFWLGRLFAEAAKAIAEKAGVPMEQVDLIGSHGQTICHLPPRKGGPPLPPSLSREPSTLQIGEAEVIAELTGVTTISDFRKRDMAAGGQGAPLVPYVDYLLFHHPERNRILINIGGISNVTFLAKDASPESTLAYDAGPGNMLIDTMVRIMTMNKQRYDKDGLIARSGQVDAFLMEQLMEHPFLALEPPKSTGREEFGEKFTEQLFYKGVSRGVKPSDLIATATTFTARALAQSLQRFVLSRQTVDEIIVSGGGALNQFLMEKLSAEMGNMELRLSEEYGIPVKGKEAIAFAILANETICLAPSNLPSATGASGPRILGKISPA